MSINPSTKFIGDRGENLVKEHLLKKGLLFIKSNIHTDFGELDLIFKDKKKIYFIEVKTRRSAEFGYPEESVDLKKLRRIKKSIAVYLRGNPHYAVLEKDILIASVLLTAHDEPEIKIINFN